MSQKNYTTNQGQVQSKQEFKLCEDCQVRPARFKCEEIFLCPDCLKKRNFKAKNDRRENILERREELAEDLQGSFASEIYDFLRLIEQNEDCWNIAGILSTLLEVYKTQTKKLWEVIERDIGQIQILICENANIHSVFRSGDYIEASILNPEE